ncbi:MAG TPA: ribonuclease H-like domain-containing protein [Candidatus Acidoferrum sp.]|nr:ribonuclease H-like domain-containing protein [Candidatus Acidoferrum sp.]
MTRKPIIHTLDIETAPIEAAVWGLWKQNVGLNQIRKDWIILSVAWKELGVAKVHYADTSEREDVRDDSELLQTIWNILDASDIIIAQNGVRFDVKKINARFLQAGMPPPRPFKVIDTLLMAKQVAAFTSNKLDWLSQILTDTPKDHHNAFPGMDLWNECLKGNPAAWRAMKRYNKRDIPSCEKVYLALRPYYQGHPNLAQYYDDEKMRCPKCGGTHLKSVGTVFTQASEYAQFQCSSCKGFSRSRYTINSKAKRKALLSN